MACLWLLLSLLGIWLAGESRALQREVEAAAGESPFFVDWIV
jgi:hypothetical protein